MCDRYDDAKPSPLDYEMDLLDPLRLGSVFVMAGLGDPIRNRVGLPQLVTPESLSGWGDFTEAAATVASIPDLGVMSVAHRAPEDEDVAYLRVVSGEDVAAIVTLVWRPDYGRWMVHHLGDYVQPDWIPRGK